MLIRHTELFDTEEIEKIYIRARDFMARTGNPDQWGRNCWPPEELIKEDIACKRSYVCVDAYGELLAVFCYMYGERADKTYDVIFGGEWGQDTPYGVVHRIASSGKVKGAGRFCIRWALEQSGYLRIDTHPDNTVMRSLLRDMGFTERGRIRVLQDDTLRIAYDKVRD